MEGSRFRLDFIWNSQKLILGNTWIIPEAWNNPRFLLKSNVQKGTENYVEKSSREKFERVLPKELIQFHFWRSQFLSLGKTWKIWAGQTDPKTLNFQAAGYCSYHKLHFQTKTEVVRDIQREGSLVVRGTKIKAIENMKHKTDSLMKMTWNKL